MHTITERKFLPVAGIEFMPDLQMGSFRIEDETVEAEDERLNHIPLGIEGNG
jgi:hypothetical protein